MQGLREDGRQRALAHVGICSRTIAPDGKPWGERMIGLAKYWANTWETELTQSQKEVQVRSTCVWPSTARDTDRVHWLHI